MNVIGLLILAGVSGIFLLGLLLVGGTKAAPETIKESSDTLNLNKLPKGYNPFGVQKNRLYGGMLEEEVKDDGSVRVTITKYGFDRINEMVKETGVKGFLKSIIDMTDPQALAGMNLVGTGTVTKIGNLIALRMMISVAVELLNRRKNTENNDVPVGAVEPELTTGERLFGKDPTWIYGKH